MQPNDWGQAVNRIIEEDGTVAAEVGGVLHVLDTCVDGDPNIINVYFERTGIVTIVHVDDVKFLGGPETGKVVCL
jgi:hypothetical protein